MAFPKTERVRYRNCPLVQVICQLRFPIDLSIDKDLPADFQKAIKEDYPTLTQSVEYGPKIGINLGDSNISLADGQFQSKVNYCFVSSDGNWSINLTDTFISLSTASEGVYTTWEDFRNRFSGPLAEFRRIYKPPFYTRVGLRYIDAYRRKKLNLEGVQWADLLQPEIMGMIACSEEGYAEEFISSNQVSDMRLEDENMMHVQVALGTINGDPSNEVGAIVDVDSFHEGQICTEGQEYEEKLNALHSNSSDFSRWSITVTMKNALGWDEIR